MRVRLSELRVAILDVLLEAIDLDRLAKRGLRGRTLMRLGSQNWDADETEEDDYGLNVPEEGDDELVLVDNKGVVVASVSIEGDSDGEWKDIASLYAHTPADAVTIMMAALGYWRAINPSQNVSPAAQSVIKRYYDQYKDDPTRIMQQSSSTRWQPWLTAIYLAPSNMPEPNVKTPRNIEQLRSLQRQSTIGFGQIYRDKTKTRKHDLELLCKLHNWTEVVDLIHDAARDEDPDSPLVWKIRKWAHDDPAGLKQVIDKVLMMPDFMRYEVKEAFKKWNIPLGALKPLHGEPDL